MRPSFADSGLLWGTFFHFLARADKVLHHREHRGHWETQRTRSSAADNHPVTVTGADARRSTGRGCVRSRMIAFESVNATCQLGSRRRAWARAQEGGTSTASTFQLSRTSRQPVHSCTAALNWRSRAPPDVSARPSANTRYSG